MANREKIQELIKLSIDQGSLPQYVYKYRILDKKKNPHFEDILNNNSMMFSSPNSFNDPFDCQLQPILFPSKKEISNYINKLLKNCSERLKQSLIDSATKDPNLFAQMLQKSIGFEKKGVLCLSKEKDNILLWSHYADSHNGVCLKFDIQKDLDFFSIPINVVYDESYPIYNHMTERDMIVNKLIQVKSNVWKYENEVRVIKNKNGLFQFNKESLVEIIFGCNCSNNDIKNVQEMVSNNNYNHLKFSQAVKKNKSFGLDFKIRN